MVSFSILNSCTFGNSVLLLLALVAKRVTICLLTVLYVCLITGDEIRYNYGPKNADWRKKQNWSKGQDGQWKFTPGMIHEIELHASRRFCEETDDRRHTELCEIHRTAYIEGNASKKPVDDSTWIFRSLQKLDRSGLPPLTVKSERINYPVFDDVRLGNPVTYVQCL